MPAGIVRALECVECALVEAALSCAARVVPRRLGVVAATALASEQFVAAFYHRVVSGVLDSLSRVVLNTLWGV